MKISLRRFESVRGWLPVVASLAKSQSSSGARSGALAVARGPWSRCRFPGRLTEKSCAFWCGASWGGLAWERGGCPWSSRITVSISCSLARKCCALWRGASLCLQSQFMFLLGMWVLGGVSSGDLPCEAPYVHTSLADGSCRRLMVFVCHSVQLRLSLGASSYLQFSSLAFSILSSCSASSLCPVRGACIYSHLQLFIEPHLVSVHSIATVIIMRFVESIHFPL